ncbi:hypothetical protein GTX14_35715 [Streptomyces sp. SID4944]|nr:hypothetical protein [Streptomyces sp. SID4944]
MSLSGLWKWAGTSPLDVPEQQGGTARGKSHTASTAATSAEGGTGREPSKGRGELDPYQRPTPDTEKATTEPVTGTDESFDEKTSERDAEKSTETTDHYVNADGSTTVRHYPGRTNFRAGTAPGSRSTRRSPRPRTADWSRPPTP